MGLHIAGIPILEDPNPKGLPLACMGCGQHEFQEHAPTCPTGETGLVFGHRLVPDCDLCGLLTENYRRRNAREKNKARRLVRHLRRHPNDETARSALRGLALFAPHEA